MLAAPRVVVRVERAADWSSAGPSAGRAEAFARHVAPAETGFRVVVEACPAAHSGLGVGTQLGLAVVEAVRHEFGLPDVPAVELARLAGRGERSAIGVYGSRTGGFLFDAGKSPGQAVGTILAAVPFPNWPVLLLRPPGNTPWSGDAERHAFARHRSASVEVSTRLAQLALTSVWPALLDGDYDGFGDALHEYNRLAGEPFAADQSGAYASPAITATVARLRTLGVKASGQSSWGPTVFGICASAAQAESVREQLLEESPELDAVLTAADNVGRAITSE
jgi:beta-RFAP synthase